VESDGSCNLTIWRTQMVSFPRNFVFQEMGYNALVNWKEKRS
jgi:hypothetical protein